MKNSLFAFFVIVLGAGSGTFAQDNTSVGSSTQSLIGTKPAEKQYGGNVGIGDPFPGILGLNVGYNLDNNIRLTAGYAEIEVTSSMSWNGNNFETQSVKAQTYAVGGEYLFTDWAVRPVAGAHVGYFQVSGDGDIEVNGFNSSTGYGYTNLGFDYIAQGGFHASLGMNVALAGATGSGFYTNLGYYY